MIYRAEKNKNNLHEIILYILLFLSALFIAMQSFFAPFASKINACDSAAFAYVGWVMKQGGRLYLDVWENKGPLLYLINYWGMLIESPFGIFF